MYLCKKDEIGMDCEQYKKAKKIYFRFLKDHGIFSRVIWLHKNGDECSIKREAPMTLDDALHYCKTRLDGYRVQYASVYGVKPMKGRCIGTNFLNCGSWNVLRRV